MPELNFVSTSATADTAGTNGQILQPYYTVARPGYNYGDADNPGGTGFMEFGSGTLGSLPWRVDQDGNTTSNSVANIPASGDQTGAADTAAIQAKWNAGIPAVLAPGSVYYVNATLNPTTLNSYLIGGGWSTQVQWNGNSVSTLIGMADTTQRRVFIRDIRLSQNGAGNPGTCINLNYFVNSIIERVLIDAGGSGSSPNIGIIGSVSGTEYNVIKDSRISAAGANAIAVKFDTNANSNSMIDCRVLISSTDATNNGVYVGAAHAIKIDHVDIEASAGTAIHVSGSASDVTIIAPYLEANGTNIQIDAGARGTIIVGGYNALATTANLVNNADATGVTYLGGRVGSNAYSHFSLLNVDKYTVNGAQVPPNQYQADDQGFAGWAFDPYVLTATSAPTTGNLYLVQLNIRYATTISKIWIYVGAGGTITANQNFLGLYSSAGTLLSSTVAGAIDTALGTATGMLGGTLQAAQSIAAGSKVWAAFLINGSVMPTIGRSATAPGAGNANLTAANFRTATNGSGLIAMPASFTPSSNAQTGDQAYWAAGS